MATLIIEINVKDDEKKNAINRVALAFADEDFDINSVNWKNEEKVSLGPLHRTREALGGSTQSS